MTARCACGAPLRVRQLGLGRASQGRQPVTCLECQRDATRERQRAERRRAAAAVRYCLAHGVDPLAWAEGIRAAEDMGPNV